MSEMLYGQEGRLKIKAGVDKLANAVKVTLGPRGRNVILNRKFGNPVVTKDGVSVAEEISLTDDVENIGARMVKDVASKTADVAGDGTTTATVLAQKLYEGGIKLIQAGFNPIEIKKGIDLATWAISHEIEKVAKKLESEQDFLRIATVSANNDTEIGTIVGDAFLKAGKTGLVTVEKSKSNSSYIKASSGVSIDRGFISPYFITDVEKSEVVLENPYILLHTEPMEDIHALLPLLEKVVEKNASILIVTNDAKEVVLNTLVLNKVQSNLKVAVIRSPGFGESTNQTMDDLAILTGGIHINSVDVKLKDADLSFLGRCEKAIIGANKTELIGSKGDKDAIQSRINELLLMQDSLEGDYEKNKIVKRISSLGTGVCTIYIGANSEVELKEKQDRYDDALNAVKSALEEGIIAGGGSTFLFIANRLKDFKGSSDSENAGIGLVLDTIKEPFRQILRNAETGFDFYIKTLEDKEYGQGLNVMTMNVENLVDSGIVDPAKVARLAIQNASSIVGTLLTTECIVY